MIETTDVLDTILNLSSDEVFTSKKVVDQVLDLLPKEVWSNPNLRFLNPACKSGIFLRECAKRLYEGLKKSIPNDKERRKHIFTKMLYGIALTHITYLMSKKTLYYAKTDDYGIFKEINQGLNENSLEYFKGNIYYENIDHTFKKNNCIKCDSSKKNIEKQKQFTKENFAYNFLHLNIKEIFGMMKFDVIIGNPPYQIGTKTIYHDFILKSIDLDPTHMAFIIPARWFIGGRGLDDFREKILTCGRIKTLVYQKDAFRIFPSVDIMGGICYFHYDKNLHNNTSFHYLNSSNKTIKKVLINLNQEFMKYNFLVTHGKGIIAKIHAKHTKYYFVDTRLKQNYFNIETNFMDIKSIKDKNYCIKVHYRKDKKRTIGYIQKKHFTDENNILSKYKLLFPESFGNIPKGNLGYKVIIAHPNEVCSATYLVLYVSESLNEIENVKKYIDSSFFKYLFYILKKTQHNSPQVFKFIPILDFTKLWSNQNIYKLFELNENEIDEIENSSEWKWNTKKSNC